MIRLGLIGYPLEHSLSPRIHQAALQALSLPGEYRLYSLVQDGDLTEKLSDLLEQLRIGDLQGLNVTVPYKQALISLLDQLTPAAAAIGAVNTIFCREGRLVGDNTDARGFMADLTAFLHLQKADPAFPKRALVLGAGGSARAVVYALLSSGWQVSLSARRYNQAQELAGQFETSKSQRPIEIVSYDPDSITEVSETTGLLVNTTPLGMWPRVEKSPWPQVAPFPRRAFVYDLVYNPARTLLLKQAQQAGLPISNGIGMLVEQAALAFETWTGISAPRQVMKAAVPEFVLS